MEKNKSREHLIGPFMKYLREEMEMTQKDLSDDTGFSIQTISKLENGKTSPRTFAAKRIIDKLITIWEVNGYDVEEMFEGFCEASEETFGLEQ
jgi:transcriptional regulator with XRE-family HTH domain